ncbi:anhydro-N-acetylmuramic acid kinase [Kushneria aurantia]|uniref:Anhydro-N-acetylmuramic acid kinase n=1 Tax=Kushneria aurantia TaxID=504092 RepID=A0ABV6G6B9_9GAMM|nr:anhydro-N-acetylmuramic acid kinase [Kushneria aurantia]
MSLVVGLMSGTSLDGIDAALLRCQADSRPQLLEALGFDMPAPLRQSLWSLCHAEGIDFAELARIETQFCRLQAQAVAALLAKSGVNATDIAAIGSHGQTIEHRPDGNFPWTCQLDNPNLLAELTGCPVVGDFRRRDLAAGGQGAPLAPAFHNALFRHDTQWRVLLNLGGFANLTLLPPHNSALPVTGFDTGPANVLLDGWHARHRGENFDSGGQWAASGRVDNNLLKRLLEDPFFDRSPPKSTGREHFHLDWLQPRLADETPADVQATLSELTVESVARALEQALTSEQRATAGLIVCGGGVHNGYLLRRLEQRLAPLELMPCEAFGWSPDWLEAGAFGWLAWRRLEGLSGNLPEVTGAAGPRILGALYHR